MSSFMPSRDGEFNVWFKNLVQYVAVKTSDPASGWKHIPVEKVRELSEAYSAWYTAYGLCLKPHIPSITSQKNTEKDAAKKIISAFKRVYLDGDEVSDAERVDMWLPPRKKIRMPVAPPVLFAEGSLSFPGIGFIEVENIHAAGSGGDLRSLTEVEIHFGILAHDKSGGNYRLAEQPKTGNDLPYAVTTKKRRRRLDFTGESGNFVFVCLRFKNSKGDTGPWGSMMKAAIP